MGRKTGGKRVSRSIFGQKLKVVKQIPAKLAEVTLDQVPGGVKARAGVKVGAPSSGRRSRPPPWFPRPPRQRSKIFKMRRP